MFCEHSEILNLLKCQHCKLPYDEYNPPKSLPCCSKIICIKCIESIEVGPNKNFKCILCKENASVPNKGNKKSIVCI